MKVATLETIRHPAHPNLLLLAVGAEDGTHGLGETFYDAAAVEEHLHRAIVPELLGAPVGNEPPGPVPSTKLRSIEWSARSALDLALHDLRARLLDIPLYELLGGAVRESAPVYVTCIDPEHPGESWGLGVPSGSSHDDWTASFTRPDELARELADQGFRAAKLFPFARIESEAGGRAIEPAALEEHLSPFRAMRAAAGPGFGLACDLAGGWALEPALQIARGLEGVAPSWLEDPLPAADLDGLRRLAAATSIPLAGHESRSGLESFRELLDTDAVSLVHLDVQWCGGLAEAARISGLAASRGLPVAFHDCAGPVAWAASLHAALAIANARWLECTRPYALDAYPAMVEGLPTLDGGGAAPGPGAGHGLALTGDFLAEARTRGSG